MYITYLPTYFILNFKFQDKPLQMQFFKAKIRFKKINNNVI